MFKIVLSEVDIILTEVYLDFSCNLHLNIFCLHLHLTRKSKRECPHSSCEILRQKRHIL